MKRYTDTDVYRAAKERVARTFDITERVYVSFSGGKDSGVMLHLVAEEARRRERMIGVLFIDLEAQYAHTIGYVEAMYAAYADVVEPFWVCLPMNLRNAVSHFEPHWTCWDPSERERWVRTPPACAITDPGLLPFFRAGMEFEEFTPAFAEWYSHGVETACFVGIRSDESLNRWRTITSEKKERKDGLAWTTRVTPHSFNAYPLYDWTTADIWTFNAKGYAYNRLYDLMHQAGLSIHQQRICQPYGDDQRRGLWLYSVIEPESWSRIVGRVSGANFGSLYARESGNVLGRMSITKPDGRTWEGYANLLLASMPEQTAEHYRNKIAVFIRWWMERGFPDGIPDDGPVNTRQEPSWARICKVLLRFDYHCKGLSFTQTKSDSYERYKERMREKREKWDLMI